MTSDPITWDRLRAIFGHPKPVLNVTERQFDYNDDKLQEMGRAHFEQIHFDDLWYYYHDLAYVELQPELFAHLFPVCLMDWHRTLLANAPCSHGDSEFHYGIVHGNVLEKMLTEVQRDQVNDVFDDSILYRLDRERGLQYLGMFNSWNGWMSRLSSLDLFWKSLPRLWEIWWELDTPGRAVCALQFCSGLMYFDGENPLFAHWSIEQGSVGPYLWFNDSYIYYRGWTEENLSFVREYVTTERIVRLLHEATKRLDAEPEAEQALRMTNDIDDRLELIESRISELPVHLASTQHEGWSV